MPSHGSCDQKCPDGTFRTADMVKCVPHSKDSRNCEPGYEVTLNTGTTTTDNTCAPCGYEYVQWRNHRYTKSTDKGGLDKNHGGSTWNGDAQSAGQPDARNAPERAAAPRLGDARRTLLGSLGPPRRR